MIASLEGNCTPHFHSIKRAVSQEPIMNAILKGQFKVTDL